MTAAVSLGSLVLPGRAASAATLRLVAAKRWSEAEAKAASKRARRGAGGDKDAAQDALVRMLERGAPPNQAFGYGKHLALEANDREQVTRDGKDVDKSGGLVPTLFRGDTPRRARPMRCHDAEALRDALHVHAIDTLSEWTGRRWTDGDVAELREIVGVVDGRAWGDVVLSVHDPGERIRAQKDGTWRRDRREVLLALRRAVVVEVDEHHALGAPVAEHGRLVAAPNSVLAAVSVLCGDPVKVTPTEYEAGMTAGEALDRIASGIDQLRNPDRAKPKERRKRRPKKSTKR